MITETQLLRLKQDIEQAEHELSELKGQQKTLLSQLEEKWQCSDIDQASKKAKKMENTIQTLQDSIDQQIEELEIKLKEDEQQDN